MFVRVATLRRWLLTGQPPQPALLTLLAGSRALARALWTRFGDATPPVRLLLAGPQLSIMFLIRAAKASIAKGFVIICMPGSKKPLAIAAFSA
jgi:hypothetical protein